MTYAATTRSRSIPTYRTGLPLIGTIHAFTKEPLTFFEHPYRSFGSIFQVRMGIQSTIVLAGLEANEFVWRHSELWNYHRRWQVFREQFDDTYIIQLDGQEHRIKRNALLQGFNTAALHAHSQAMCRTVQKEVQCLPQNETDLRTFCARTVLSMAGQALLRAELPYGLERNIVTIERTVLTGKQLGPLRHLWYRRESYQRVRREVFALINTILDEREADPDAHGDLLALILQARARSASFPQRHEVAQDVFLLLEPTVETTAHLLLWALLFLSEHEHWLLELRAELDTWDGSRFQSLNDWPKLKATVFEIERLRPPVPFQGLTPFESFTYQGYTIPRNAPIIHIATLPHFLSDIYEKPASFQPQRFLGQNYPARANGTYGGGEHYCLGKMFARVLTALALAELVTGYDLHLGFRPSLRGKMGALFTPIETAMPARILTRERIATPSQEPAQE